MVMADALMQMCDGIHGTSRFMRIDCDGVVHTEPVAYIKGCMNLQITPIGRVELLDRMEEVQAPFIDMERVYGEYNSFAKSDAGEFFAWYNNDR